MKLIIYCVKKNETLEKICSARKLSLQQVRRLNLLEEVHEGMRLLLPDVKTYRVKPFETWEEIALKTGVSVDKLKEWNSSELFFGQILKLEQ